MKTNNLIWVAAAGLLMTACAANEPDIINGETEEGSNGHLYMSVNIQDAGQTQFGAPARQTRAGDYQDGSAFEHTVTSARFFFFDASGRYITEANIWRDGSEVTDNDNIEYKGKNMLVLKNVTDRQSIKYMLTVLNAPADLQPVENLTTLQELATTTFSSIWRDATVGGNNQKVFYMSTSSFNPEGKEGYSPEFYYANTLSQDDFITVADNAADINPDAITRTVNVYVERLAAKVSLEGIKEYFPITMTVAGSVGNPELDPDPDQVAAGQKLYIHFENWAVSGVEAETYLSKQLNISKNYFTNWNSADRFRSFWAESCQYGKEPVLQHKTFAQVTNSISQPAYEKETTNETGFITKDGALLRNNVASALITATICAEDASGKKVPVDMVRFQGVLHTKPQYIAYELKALNANGKLNFYKRTATGFKQIGSEDVKFATASAFADANVILTYAGGSTDALYTLTEGADPALESSYTAISVAELNRNLADFNKTAPAEAYEGGKMFYSIPIRHLVAANGNMPVLGNYGLVRNHWYQISINKVVNLGHGVFDPVQQPLKPGETENPDKFGLGASINVVSWRIVNQSVDL